MKPFPWKCGECREREVQPKVLSTYETDLDHDGRSYHVELTDFPVLECQRCGARLIQDEGNRRLSEALRQAVGLLSPVEIKAHRDALGLTQKQLAEYLRISESTLSRWETGAQIQQRAMDVLLRGFFDLEAFRGYLGAVSKSRRTATTHQSV